MPELYLALEDQYGQIVGSDNTSTITLYVNSTSVETTFDKALAGQVTHFSYYGTFKISNISFTSEPAKEYGLYFRTTGIDETKASNQNYMQAEEMVNYNFKLTVQLRSCIEGEQFSMSGSCDL